MKRGTLMYIVRRRGRNLAEMKLITCGGRGSQLNPHASAENPPRGVGCTVPFWGNFPQSVPNHCAGNAKNSQLMMYLFFRLNFLHTTVLI
jgi:hypothetical protein